MVKVEIGAPAKKETPRDAFLIVCTGMYGDGDGTEDVILGQFPNTERFRPYLHEAIEFCERMKNYFPQGKSTWDTYAGIKDGDKWFGFAMDDEDMENEVPPIYSEITAVNTKYGWATDPTSDHVGDATFTGYTVQYFDAEGIEHEVKITGL